MGVLNDFWSMLPTQVKFFVALAIFLYAGSTILQAIVVLWNLLGVNAINLVNGCAGGNAAACIPQQEGIYILGLNFADYWTITIIVLAIPIIAFAFKWYAAILKKD